MSIVDWIYPKICFGCGKEGSYICQDCESKILVPPQVCPACMKPSLGGWVHARCRTLYGVDRLVVGLPYKGIVQRALKKVKYAGSWDIVHTLFGVWTKKLDSRFEILGNTVITSVPMYERKERERGFNQADLLAELVAKHFNLEYTPLLQRVHRTQPMYGLTKKERRENVRGAFQLTSQQLNIKTFQRIFLVDDVWTTGATIGECTRLLKRKGAAHVWGATLAR